MSGLHLGSPRPGCRTRRAGRPPRVPGPAPCDPGPHCRGPHSLPTGKEAEGTWWQSCMWMTCSALGSTPSVTTITGGLPALQDGKTREAQAPTPTKRRLSWPCWVLQARPGPAPAWVGGGAEGPEASGQQLVHTNPQGRAHLWVFWPRPWGEGVVVLPTAPPCALIQGAASRRIHLWGPNTPSPGNVPGNHLLERGQTAGASTAPPTTHGNRAEGGCLPSTGWC